MKESALSLYRKIRKFTYSFLHFLNPSDKMIHYFYHLHQNPYQPSLYSGFDDTWAIYPGDISESLFRLKYKGGKVVFHLHWTIQIFEPGMGLDELRSTAIRFLEKIDKFTSKGGIFVHTAHNLYPHDTKQREFYRWFTAELFKRGLIHFHSESAIEICTKEYGVGPKNSIVVPHGNYDGIYPPTTPEKIASRKEKWGAQGASRIFGFVGQIRAYKGVRKLLSDYSRFYEMDQSTILVVAGKLQKCETTLDDLRALAPNGVIIHPDYIRDEDISEYLSSLDILIFPYQDILTSGSIMLAFSYGKPVIIPRIPALMEFKDLDAVTMYDPDEKDGLVNALQHASAMSEKEYAIAADSARKYADDRSWAVLSRNLMQAIESRFD